MEERGIDRRVRKTKRQLRQALMDLMSEKPSKSISVRELAERADINRGTFYIHYKDVSDLLQRLEDEMAERLILVCKKYAYSTSEVDAFPYLTELYRFARDNADLCLVLLGPNGDRAYTERICGILRSYFLRDFLARFYSGSSDRLDYFCSFIVSGNLTLTLEGSPAVQRRHRKRWPPWPAPSSWTVSGHCDICKETGRLPCLFYAVPSQTVHR